MNGHYHVEFSNGPIVNDSIEKVAAAIKRSPCKVKSVGFICTYGCGNIHELTPEDRKALGLNPDLTRRSDVDALIELCDQASELADDCGELGSSAPSDVQAKIAEIKKAIRALHAKKPPKPRKKG